MRHQWRGKILGRKKEARRALLRNLATSLILYEKIKTTKAKAQAVKPLVEKIITLGKNGDLASRRQILGKVQGELTAKKVIEVLAPRLKKRQGGYVRVVKLGRRLGDAAELVQLEIV